MTVASEVNRSGPYIGNGATTVFDYEFRILDQAHIKVIQTQAGAETVLTLGTDYSVSGVGDDGGGSVTMVVAPTLGQTITLLRNAPFTQETDLENQGAYFAETIEAALDLSAMRDQQLSERLDRAVVIPASADVASLETLIQHVERLYDSADNIDVLAQIVWMSTTVDTIAALKALDKSLYNRAQVNGYYALGDCRTRSYYRDAADTASADNGGSIIVANDGARWKLVDNRVWTCKMFGAREDGTDQATVLGNAITVAAAANVPLEFDGNFCVSSLVVTDKHGLHWIGRGGLIGIASSAQDAVVQFITCTDVTINGRFVVNGAYNGNYTYGFHGYTNAVSQDFQLFDLTNVIIVGCKTAWGFGNAARPDDDVAAINIRGGYTSGCPQYLKAIGSQTVVQVSGANVVSGYGSGDATWQTLPAVAVEAQGATVLIVGGEVMCTQITHDCAFKVSAIASANSGPGGVPANLYGNISVAGSVCEIASALCFTDNKSLASPIRGAFTMTGCRFVLTLDTFGGAVQTDAAFGGQIVIVGNTGFAPSVRGQFNINAGSPACQIVVDMPSFGVACLQGYDGINGGTPVVIGGDVQAWKTYAPAIAAQSGAITTLGPVSASYQRSGKTAKYTFDIQITTAGSAAGAIKVGLPFTAKAGKNFVGACYEYNTAGASGTAVINPTVNDANNLYIRTASGGSFFADGRKVTGTIEYEMA